MNRVSRARWVEEMHKRQPDLTDEQLDMLWGEMITAGEKLRAATRRLTLEEEVRLGLHEQPHP